MKSDLSHASRPAVDNDPGSADAEHCAAPVSPLISAVNRGIARIGLPLGGVASTDPTEVREPWIRPFWLLAAGLGLAIAIFVWLRVNLF
jgi:hypothetical protein